MRTITIQTDREEKFILFTELAKKLNVTVLHTDDNEVNSSEDEEFENDEAFAKLFEKELGITLSSYREEILSAEKEEGFTKEEFFANLRQWRKAKDK